jgi:dihydrofolate reductase/thymidylate synthase
MRDFEIVVAADELGGIGNQGEIPWRLPGDVAFHNRNTSETISPHRRNAVVMGRKTWETIPVRFRPLKRRLNAVITRQRGYSVPGGVICATSLERAIEEVAAHGDAIERIFVLGGGEIYRLAAASPACRTVHLTRVEGHFHCDAHFPALGDDYQLVDQSERHEEGGVGYVFQRWQRRG